jgi:hypothetical protein
MHVLKKHLSKLFEIAAEKYEVGLIEAGNVISVTEADVAQKLG